MALQALKFNAEDIGSTTRDGVTKYAGTTTEFYDWEFRAWCEWDSKPKDEDKPEAMNKILRGLTGDASRIARDIGRQKLMSKEGMKLLVDELKAGAFPKARDDAKELYREGQKTHGILARQYSEPMNSYCTRRTRWWKTIKEHDPAMELSSEIRGDLLLDAANLNEIEKLMVLTSAHNDRSFEAISKALQEQHPRIHLKEKADKFRRRDDDKKGRGKG